MVSLKQISSTSALNINNNKMCFLSTKRLDSEKSDFTTQNIKYIRIRQVFKV